MFSLACVWTLAVLASAVTAQEVDASRQQQAFYCNTRCLASCLETSLGDSVLECQDFCPNFVDGPCSDDDDECWRNCAMRPTIPARGSMRKVNNLHTEYASQSIFAADAPSNLNVKVYWDALDGATLYIVELYPLGMEPSEGEKMIQRFTATDNSYTFRKPNMCSLFLIRVMGVNPFELSPPSEVTLDAWMPDMFYDEYLDVRSMARVDLYEGDQKAVKVIIDYTRPDGWGPGDVEIQASSVRARDCLGLLSDKAFADDQPDEEGMYSPIVFINETDSVIELIFPSDILFAQCLFSYRITSLRTRCNVTNDRVMAAVDFAVNCQSVENADCVMDVDSSTAGSTTDVSTTEDSFDGSLEWSEWPSTDQTVAEVSTTTENMEELPLTVAPTDGDVETSLYESQETDPESSTEFNPAEDLDLFNYDDQTSTATTADVSPTTDAVSAEQIDISIEENSGSDDSPTLPVVEITEKLPLQPVCDLSEFNVQTEVKLDAPIATANVTVSWMEQTPSEPESRTPSYFIIRMGPVERTLIENAQSDIVPGEETIVRSNRPVAVAQFIEDPARMITLIDLPIDSLYAFQICAIYSTEETPPNLAWNTIKRYTVDLAAVAPPKAAEDVLSTPKVDAAATTTAAEYPVEVDDILERVDIDLVPASPILLNVIDVKPMVQDVQNKPALLQHIWMLLLAVVVLASVLISLFLTLKVRRSLRKNTGAGVQYQFPPSGTPPAYQQQEETKIAMP